MGLIIQIALGCYISQLLMGLTYIVLDLFQHMGCDHE